MGSNLPASQRCPLVDANKTEPWLFPIIYPFGANLSQMDAVDNALSHTLSIIEGPLGTGKTQTILNIVANLISRNKTVLVISPNNETTKNVVDKLMGAGFGHVVAPLGNKDNRVLFVARQPGYPKCFDEWRLSKSVSTLLESLIKRKAADVHKLLTAQHELAQAKDSLREWELEQRAFVGRFPQVKGLKCPKGMEDEHYCTDGDKPRERPRFRLDDLWHFPQELRREYPVITSNANSARKQLSEGYVLFDWVIIGMQADVLVCCETISPGCSFPRMRSLSRGSARAT